VLFVNRRDFRRYKLNETNPEAGPVVQPILWQFDNVHQVNDLEYSASYSAPPSGWLAFFIQVSLGKTQVADFHSSKEIFKKSFIQNYLPNKAVQTNFQHSMTPQLYLFC